MIEFKSCKKKGGYMFFTASSSIVGSRISANVDGAEGRGTYAQVADVTRLLSATPASIRAMIAALIATERSDPSLQSTWMVTEMRVLGYIVRIIAWERTPQMASSISLSRGPSTPLTGLTKTSTNALSGSSVKNVFVFVK